MTKKQLIGKDFFSIFGLILLGFLFISCATTKKIATPINYSDEKIVGYEIENIKKILVKDPYESLIRAHSLIENTNKTEQMRDLYLEAQKRSIQEFEQAVTAGRWTEAIDMYKSLQAFSVAPAQWTLSNLEENRILSWKNQGNVTLANLDVPISSTPEDEAPSSKIVASLIRGTVTVWVDRGIKIQGGVGYADRVIGSGFFIDDRGYIITNYHVIESEVNPKYEGYSRLFIKTADDQETRIPARVIGWDPVLDLALLKTEIKPPVVFSLGSSEDLQVGNRIYAIGSPAGLNQTLTSGIVSARKRRLLSLADVLQIDAPINHGNSGGPIIDELGRVQAVVFAGIEPYEGLNFAIPVEYLRIVLPDLYAGGKVVHSWTGSYGKTTYYPGTTENAGVSLIYTLGNSPFAIAGIPEGTVITSFNGIRITTLEELQAVIIREHVGVIVQVKGFDPSELTNKENSSAEKTWLVRLTQRPELPSKIVFESDLDSRALLPVFGLNIHRVGSSQKYRVVEVIKGSIADESGFSDQDIIELKQVLVDESNGFVGVQLYTKRRKSGYLESFIGLAASLDSSSYF